MNSLMYRFLVNNEDKAVAKDFVKGLAHKGIESTETQAHQLLEQGKKIYSKFYTDDIVKKTFTQPGEFHNFIKTNLEQMEDSRLKEMVTERGIGLKISDAENIPTEKLNNISSLYETIHSEGLDPKKKEILSGYFDKQMQDVVSFLDGGLYKGNKVEEASLKSPDYVELANNTKQLIDNARSFKTKNGYSPEIQEATRQIISNLNVINSKYTYLKNQKAVTLTNLSNPSQTMQVAIDDLPTMVGKDWAEILRENKVRFKDADEEAEFSIRLGQDKNINVVGHHFMKPFHQSIEEFIQRNQHRLADSAIGQSVDGVSNTIKNIVFGTGTVTLKLGSEAKDLKEANEILKDLMPIVKDAFESFFGKDTLTHINDINSLMDTKMVKKYNEENNAVDIRDYIQFLENQDGKFNISHGTFKDKKGQIVAAMYLSFGKEYNNPDFMKEITGIVKKEDGTEVFNFAGYIEKFKNVHKTIIEQGLDAEGKFDIEKGILRARGIVTAKNGNSLFKDGKLDYDSVKNYLASMNIFRAKGNVDQITSTLMNIFGHTISEHNNLTRAFILNFVHNYVKNKELIDAFLKNVDKFNVKTDEWKALTHIILYGDDNYVKKLAGNFKKSPAMAEEVKRIEEILEGNIQNEIQFNRESLLAKQLEIEENIRKLRDFREQMSDVIQIQKLTKQIDEHIQMSQSIRKQIEKIDSIFGGTMNSRIEDLYKEHIVSLAKNLAADVLTGTKSQFESLTKKLESSREQVEKIVKLPDGDKQIIESIMEEVREAKNAGNISGIVAVKDKHTKIDYGKRMNEIIADIFRAIPYSSEEVNLVDFKQLEKHFADMA